MFGLTGTLIAAEGKGDELEHVLVEAAAELDAVADCRLYVVSRLADEPDTVHVTEVWTDEQAHRASLELPAVQRLIASARPILAGMGDRTTFRPVGGKGL